jgi:hypothetical protein
MSAFNPEIAARAIMPRDLLLEASSKHLCIHLSYGNIQVAVAEAAGRDIQWAEEFTTDALAPHFKDVVDFCAGRNWSEKIFRKCTLTYDTPLFALVPAAFYDFKKQAELLEFHTGQESHAAAALHLPEMDAYLVYEQEPHVRTLIKQFPNVRIFPTAYLLIKHALLSAEKNEAELHLVHLRQAVLLAVIKDRKLMLINQFDASNDEDALYHASNAAMRLGIDFENAHLHLYQFPNNETLEPLLKVYNAHLEHAFADYKGKINASFPAHLHILCA